MEQSSGIMARGPKPEFLDVGGRRLRHQILRGPGDAVVLALDLPGHGESSRDVGSGSLGELAMAVLGYMGAVGIDRAHLVGHSMGAAACLDLTDRAPDRVRSVTLIGPAGTGQKINADFIRGFLTGQPRAARALDAPVVCGPGLHHAAEDR